MVELYNLTKVKMTLAALTLIKYASWCGFFIYQGKAIQQAIDKTSLVHQLLQTLLLFFVTKIVVMLADVMAKFVIDYSENNETKTQWKRFFPRKIFRDNETKQNLIYLNYFDLLPNLYQLECKLITNRGTIGCVFLIVISLLSYTGFYYGLVAVTIVVFLNYLSKNIGLSKFNKSHKAINENKSITIGWIAQYFNAYREIAFNWPQQINVWAESAYNNLHESRKRFIVLHLCRDVSTQLLVEIPFVLNTCVVIIAVYLDYLNLSQLFVWIGLSQLVINASNAFLENKVHQGKKKILREKLEEIRAQFYYKDDLQPVRTNSKDLIKIKLQDSSVNQLSLKPGIYPIKGCNGSGKSTLLNSVLGYERFINIDNSSELQQMLASVSLKNIRVIERDPVIFNEFHHFNQQILGPELAQSLDWQTLLSLKIKYLFSKDLALELNPVLKQVESKFNQRKLSCFSSGEKILISFMRALVSWDKDVSILVVDECTAFLDSKIKNLFLNCLSELSVRTAIYLSGHEIYNLDSSATGNLKLVNNFG